MRIGDMVLQYHMQNCKTYEEYYAGITPILNIWNQIEVYKNSGITEVADIFVKRNEIEICNQPKLYFQEINDLKYWGILLFSFDTVSYGANTAHTHVHARKVPFK